jgi:magnesium transporter
MTATDRWIDLLDPTPEEITRHVPESIHARALEQLTTPGVHTDEPRAKLEGHGDYVFGVLLVAVDLPDEDQVYYQEVNFVMSREQILTVRKTPPGGRPAYDPVAARESCRESDSIGMVAYHLLDDVADKFLDLIDSLTDEIEELEEGIDQWDADRIRRRIADLRHDMLNTRRTLTPLRDAVRQVVDDRIDFEGEEVFNREVELNFAAVYDKLLRATDSIDLARDLVAGARDYHQSKVANDQNDVMKRLTVVASILLLPTFIVGLYGQNFIDIPELRWHYGYLYGWGLIIGTTLAQLAYFRKKQWF